MTNKTKLDISYNKLVIRVVSEVVEELKAYDLKKLKKIQKNLTFQGKHILAPSLICINLTLAIALKRLEKHL